uniref:DUF2867 domain-containing protein n=1 Tax=Paracoccus sp. TRP TaxID=412597 RepID=UPI0009FCD6EF|nr:DUF2867 domain-containing protein [Paracoccus sp. TRP]
MRLTFRIRDAVSVRFGVRRIGGSGREPGDNARVAEKLGSFLVEQSTPDLLVLNERDRHLDVMTCISTQGAELAITSSVVTHNRCGRAYMVVAGPAHRLIVRTLLLRRLKRD